MSTDSWRHCHGKRKRGVPKTFSCDFAVDFWMTVGPGRPTRHTFAHRPRATQTRGVYPTRSAPDPRTPRTRHVRRHRPSRRGRPRRACRFARVQAPNRRRALARDPSASRVVRGRHRARRGDHQKGDERRAGGGDEGTSPHCFPRRRRRAIYPARRKAPSKATRRITPGPAGDLFASYALERLRGQQKETDGIRSPSLHINRIAPLPS